MDLGTIRTGGGLALLGMEGTLEILKPGELPEVKGRGSTRGWGGQGGW